MLPNWIIIGAPKAGTSSVFQWLADHPEVCGSREKETYYFVDPGTHMHMRSRNFADHGLAGYETLFGGKPGARVVVEATPGYMYHETALRELPRLPSAPHFIVLLREPVAQVRSLFRYFQQNWDWVPRSMSFPDFVETVERGTSSFKGNELASGALRNANYVEALRRWRDAAGGERLHVYLFEDMIADPRGFMTRLAAEMKIDPGFYETYGFPVENETYVVRNGLLQTLNIRLRGLIPQGRLYGALRRVYRAANTMPVQRTTTPTAGEADVERMLSRRYLTTLPELESEFGLELSGWRRTLEARLATGDVSDLPDGPRASATPRPDLNQA